MLTYLSTYVVLHMTAHKFENRLSRDSRNKHTFSLSTFIFSDDLRDDVSPENIYIVCIKLYFVALCYILLGTISYKNAFMMNLSTDLNILYNTEKIFNDKI